MVVLALISDPRVVTKILCRVPDYAAWGPNPSLLIPPSDEAGIDEHALTETAADTMMTQSLPSRASPASARPPP